MGWSRRFILVAIGLLSACGHECKLAGCVSGVSVELANTFPVELLPVEVTTCADEVCATEVITPAMAAPDQATFGVGGSVMMHEARERDVVVSIEVRSTASDQILVNASGTGHLVRSQPNGAGCGPTCYGTTLTYPGAGHLLTGR